jgi:hypothetical protein
METLLGDETTLPQYAYPRDLASQINRSQRGLAAYLKFVWSKQDWYGIVYCDAGFSTFLHSDIFAIKK